MIRVKRVYDDREENDGLRILVDRMWPRGLSKERASVDLWLKDLAPSDGLRRWFGHNPKRWSEFKKRYHRELGKHSEVLGAFKERADKDTITLLYAAKDISFNNAVALLEYLQGRRDGEQSSAPESTLAG